MLPTDFAPRLISLSLAFAFSFISGSVGLNALVKSNQQRSAIRKDLPPGTSVNVNDNNVFRSGVVITTVSAIIAVLSLIYLLMLLLSRRKDTTSSRLTPLSERSLPFQWISLAFLAVWLFATQIPFTHFFATRSAQVHAFVGNIELPASVVQIVQNQLGLTTVYKKIGYLRLLAILPWFALLSTTIAAGVCFLASRRPVSKNRPSQNEDEKN